MEDHFEEPPEDLFDMDYQFYRYLKKVGLPPWQIPKGQYGELKRAFFGAMGQMLMLVSFDMPKLSEEEAAEKTILMTQQISEFWKGEAEKHTRVNN